MQYTNHERDSLGWPLCNCDQCRTVRLRMADQHWSAVLDGVAEPDLALKAEQREDDSGH